MDTYKITTMTNPLTIEDEDRKIDIYDKSIKELFFKDRHTIIVRRLYEEGEAVSTYNLTEESYHWKKYDHINKTPIIPIISTIGITAIAMILLKKAKSKV